MSRWHRPVRPSLILAAVLSAVGCQTPPPVGGGAPLTPRPPTTAPTSAPARSFDDPNAGIRFSYPAGWVAQPTTGTTQLRLTAPSGDGSAVLTLDVPHLPPHLPGWIPIGLVASGYVDDLKKRMPDATGAPPADVPVPGAQARRVTMSDHDAAGQATTDDAVLIVHGDHVYVLAVDSDPPARPAAAAALATAIASITWTR